MLSVDVSTRERGGQVVVALRGELDMADVASVATALSAVATLEREIIVDLAGLEFIDCSGVAALVRARNQARTPAVTCCSPRRSSRCCGSLPSPA